jgi:hypothetical protein
VILWYLDPADKTANLILNDQVMPNSNILVTGMNVNTSEEPLGQTIVDNLEEMREWFS